MLSELLRLTLRTVSVRDPILTDHFWLNPLSQHFSQICVSDLILVNEAGQVVEGDEPINAAAFAIHSESRHP
jgi:ribulose-5-phosphate 4-epimerase/fuculose-1-phosphate aldolase